MRVLRRIPYPLGLLLVGDLLGQIRLPLLVILVSKFSPSPLMSFSCYEFSFGSGLLASSRRLLSCPSLSMSFRLDLGAGMYVALILSVRFSFGFLTASTVAITGVPIRKRDQYYILLYSPKKAVTLRHEDIESTVVAVDEATKDL